MNWEQARKITAVVQSIVSSVAFLVVGSWAYYRFIRFRTLKPRLQFSFKFRKAEAGNGIVVVAAELKASNKGNGKVDLRKNAIHQGFLRCGIVSISDLRDDVSIISKPGKELERIDKVFASHAWIEPGETIDDVKLINVPARDVVALQIEPEIFGLTGTRWSSVAAFLIASDNNGSSFTSEDEQDEYEDSEALIAAIETNANRAKARLKSPNLPLDLKKKLQDLIERAPDLIRQLAIESSVPERLREDGERFVKESDKCLD